MALTKEQLLGAAPRSEWVDALEFGGQILVREPDGATYERLASADYPIGKDGKVVFNATGRMARWVIATVRNADGSAMFSDADAANISAMPSGLLRRIVEAAERVSGMKAGAIEDAAKNS